MIANEGVEQIEGRTLTSWPSLQTDIRNPGDLPVFCREFVARFQRS